ncbi:D-alanyl-D-alanine carboxypeptidase family protein [Proteiniclasticum sp. C24MP]|uniref:D-alanyl-D-alanine carboxypeptidase family protein n=1 Tax=Proteiniclasticum sp. C24MP TaxID=3374101 RepID=UPI003754EFDB
MMKLSRMIILTLVVSTITVQSVFGSTIDTKTPPPETFSESIVVMDAETGVVLYDKQSEKQNLIASTTKVMTALLAIEMLDLEKIVTVGPNPPYAKGASMGFKEGEEIMVIDLLYALMLHSANDAAEILAEEVSGSIEAFAELMTERAHSIGAVNTEFYNPSGLYYDEGENNRSTARDLALITAEAGKNEKLVEIAQKRSHMLPLTNLLTDMNRWATNKNNMMRSTSQYYYEPVIMGKTGWTPEAGYSYTAMAEKDGRRLVVSIVKGVNQNTYWTESKELFEWAFDNTSVHVLYKKGQEMKKIVLPDGEERTLVAREDFHYISIDQSEPKPLLEFSEIVITEDHQSGDVIDTVNVLINEEEVGKIDLVCESDIVFTEAELEESQILDEIKENSFLNKIVPLLLGTTVILVLLLIGIRMLNTAKRRKRRKMSHKRMEYLKRIENQKR